MDCGAIDNTGTRCPGNPGLGFAARTERTSVWDWRVIRTDSAEVIQPLYGFQMSHKWGEMREGRTSPAC